MGQVINTRIQHGTPNVLPDCELTDTKRVRLTVADDGTLNIAIHNAKASGNGGVIETDGEKILIHQLDNVIRIYAGPGTSSDVIVDSNCP